MEKKIVCKCLKQMHIEPINLSKNDFGKSKVNIGNEEGKRSVKRVRKGNRWKVRTQLHKPENFEATKQQLDALISRYKKKEIYRWDPTSGTFVHQVVLLFHIPQSLPPLFPHLHC